jgi:hypothetical protein
VRFLCFLNRCLAAGHQVIRRTITSAQSISTLALGIASGLLCQMHTGVWYIACVSGTTSTICMDHGGLPWKTSMRRTFLCTGFSSVLVTSFGLMQVRGLEQQEGQREKEVNTTAFLLRILFMSVKYVFLSDNKHYDELRKRSEDASTWLQHMFKMKSSRCRILRLELF